MGMCSICGGWDCIFCNGLDLINEALAAREAGKEKEWVASIVARFEKVRPLDRDRLDLSEAEKASREASMPRWCAKHAVPDWCHDEIF